MITKRWKSDERRLHIDSYHYFFDGRNNPYEIKDGIEMKRKAVKLFISKKDKKRINQFKYCGTIVKYQASMIPDDQSSLLLDIKSIAVKFCCRSLQLTFERKKLIEHLMKSKSDQK